MDTFVLATGVGVSWLAVIMLKVAYNATRRPNQPTVSDKLWRGVVSTPTDNPPKLSIRR